MHRRPTIQPSSGVVIGSDEVYVGSDDESNNGKTNKRRDAVLMGVMVLALVLVLAVVLLPPLLAGASTFESQLPSRVAQAETVKAAEELKVNVAVAKQLEYVPLVLLSTGRGKWNTGVWTGFGPKITTLNWAAAGVVVDKTQCPFECEFTQDQSQEEFAHVVLMELVNHPKFLGAGTSEPIPWPAHRTRLRAPFLELPFIGNFFYEPTHAYPEYTSAKAILDKVDFTVGPDSSFADIPITLVCPWGQPVENILKPSPPKTSSGLVAYFNEHGIAPEHNTFVLDLLRALGEDLHSYNMYSNRPMPAEAGGDPYQLSRRLEFVGTYKFVLITEATAQSDWVQPNWSQAFLAGAVPVYIGAPNIRAFTPGPKSFVDVREFASAEQLASFLRTLAADDAAYNRYFDWKAGGLSAQYQKHLHHCAHYAECRICEWSRKALLDLQTRADLAAEVAGMV